MIIVNEAAGDIRSDRVRRAIDLTRQALDADVLAWPAGESGPFESWVRERVDSYRTVILAGGDGSLAAAFNAVADRDGVTLGYIPAGVGNATAHLLRLPRDPEVLAGMLAGGDARAVDLVAVDGRLALFVGAGWDARVVQRYPAAGQRRLAGWVWAVARSLPDLVRPSGMEVRADGWLVHRGPIQLLVVSTTPFYGRGLRVNPGARTDAGRLTLRVYPGGLPSLALESARWVTRRSPHAQAVHAREIEIRSTDGRPLPLQADGDLVGERDTWRFELRPAAVRLIGRWAGAG